MRASEFADMVRRRHINYFENLGLACGIEPAIDQLAPGQVEADDNAWRAICYS